MPVPQQMRNGGLLLLLSHELRAVDTGDATLKRGFDSLERCWQSHAGPSNLIPSLPAEPDFLTNAFVGTPPQLLTSSNTAIQPGLAAACSVDRPPGKDGFESAPDQAPGQQGAAVAPVSRLCMGNATLDRNLQSLQRRWDSQKSRSALCLPHCLGGMTAHGVP